MRRQTSTQAESDSISHVERQGETDRDAPHVAVALMDESGKDKPAMNSCLSGRASILELVRHQVMLLFRTDRKNRVAICILAILFCLLVFMGQNSPASQRGLAPSPATLFTSDSSEESGWDITTAPSISEREDRIVTAEAEVEETEEETIQDTRRVVSRIPLLLDEEDVQRTATSVCMSYHHAVDTVLSHSRPNGPSQIFLRSRSYEQRRWMENAERRHEGNLSVFGHTAKLGRNWNPDSLFTVRREAPSTATLLEWPDEPVVIGQPVYLWVHMEPSARSSGGRPEASGRGPGNGGAFGRRRLAEENEAVAVHDNGEEEVEDMSKVVAETAGLPLSLDVESGPSFSSHDSMTDFGNGTYMFSIAFFDPGAYVLSLSYPGECQPTLFGNSSSSASSRSLASLLRTRVRLEQPGIFSDGRGSYGLHITVGDRKESRDLRVAINSYSMPGRWMLTSCRDHRKNALKVQSEACKTPLAGAYDYKAFESHAQTGSQGDGKADMESDSLVFVPFRKYYQRLYPISGLSGQWVAMLTSNDFLYDSSGSLVDDTEWLVQLDELTSALGLPLKVECYSIQHAASAGTVALHRQYSLTRPSGLVTNRLGSLHRYVEYADVRGIRTGRSSSRAGYGSGGMPRNVALAFTLYGYGRHPCYCWGAVDFSGHYRRDRYQCPLWLYHVGGGLDLTVTALNVTSLQQSSEPETGGERDVYELVRTVHRVLGKTRVGRRDAYSAEGDPDAIVFGVGDLVFGGPMHPSSEEMDSYDDQIAAYVNQADNLYTQLLSSYSGVVIRRSNWAPFSDLRNEEDATRELQCSAYLRSSCRESVVSYAERGNIRARKRTIEKLDLYHLSRDLFRMPQFQFTSVSQRRRLLYSTGFNLMLNTLSHFLEDPRRRLGNSVNWLRDLQAAWRPESNAHPKAEWEAISSRHKYGEDDENDDKAKGIVSKLLPAWSDHVSGDTLEKYKRAMKTEHIDRAPAKYIMLLESQAGLGGWVETLVDLLYAAKALNRTLVEPCVSHGRIRPCSFRSVIGSRVNYGDHTFPLSYYMDLSSLRRYYGNIVSYFDFWRRWHGDKDKWGASDIRAYCLIPNAASNKKCKKLHDNFVKAVEAEFESDEAKQSKILSKLRGQRFGDLSMLDAQYGPYAHLSAEERKGGKSFRNEAPFQVTGASSLQEETRRAWLLPILYLDRGQFKGLDAELHQELFRAHVRFHPRFATTAERLINEHLGPRFLALQVRTEGRDAETLSGRCSVRMASTLRRLLDRAKDGLKGCLRAGKAPGVTGLAMLSDLPSAGTNWFVASDTYYSSRLPEVQGALQSLLRLSHRYQQDEDRIARALAPSASESDDGAPLHSFQGSAVVPNAVDDLLSYVDPDARAALLLEKLVIKHGGTLPGPHGKWTKDPAAASGRGEHRDAGSAPEGYGAVPPAIQQQHSDSSESPLDGTKKGGHRGNSVSDDWLDDLDDLPFDPLVPLEKQKPPPDVDMNGENGAGADANLQTDAVVLVTGDPVGGPDDGAMDDAASDVVHIDAKDSEHMDINDLHPLKLYDDEGHEVADGSPNAAATDDKEGKVADGVPEEHGAGEAADDPDLDLAKLAEESAQNTGNGVVYLVDRSKIEALKRQEAAEAQQRREERDRERAVREREEAAARPPTPTPSPSPQPLRPKVIERSPSEDIDGAVAHAKSKTAAKKGKPDSEMDTSDDSRGYSDEDDLDVEVKLWWGRRLLEIVESPPADNEVVPPSEGKNEEDAAQKEDVGDTEQQTIEVEIEKRRPYLPELATKLQIFKSDMYIHVMDSAELSIIDYEIGIRAKYFVTLSPEQWAKMAQAVREKEEAKGEGKETDKGDGEVDWTQCIREKSLFRDLILKKRRADAHMSNESFDLDKYLSRMRMCA